MAKSDCSIAQQWQTKIDKRRPTGHYLAVDRRAVKKMEGNAVEVKESFEFYIYIFEDGSSLYEKHRDDWFCGGDYAQCPSCGEWREHAADNHNSNICDDCDQSEAGDEQATGILKSGVSN
jgi:hypothetical protein